MKIIYAPEYEGNKQSVITAEKPCLLGVSYVGNMGLLSQLELRLGMSCDSETDIEREARLVQTIRKHPDNLFHSLAEGDELGTAHKLLQWRDALLMAGWNPESDQPSEKLSALAGLEKKFNGEGMADRWRDIMRFSAEKKYDLAGLEIVVETAEKHLPFLIRKTLQGVRAHGAKVVYLTEWKASAAEGSDLRQLQEYLCSGELPAFQGDHSLRILNFNTPNDAYEWFAHNPDQKGVVAVNQDGEMLNHILSSWNLPLTQAECGDSNPQITQLFKLGLSLFERPLNIYNLLSYLQIPLHPIPSMLRRKLASVLCNEGGIGKSWHQTIEDYPFAENEKEAKEIRKKKSIFWDMVEKENDKLNIKEVVSYNQTLMEWAQGMLHISDEDKRPDAATAHQLHALCTFCSAFKLLVGEEDHIKLNEMIRSIYRPTNFVIDEAQQHSVTTLPNIGELANATPHMVWLDCVNKPSSVDTFEFLTREEQESLNKAGIEIPPYTEVLQEQREAMIRSLCRVEKSLTVVTTTYEGNKKTNEHPFVAEVKMLMGDAFKMETPERNLEAVKEMPTDRRIPQATYEVSPIEIPPRTQSNKSLTQLIHFPFDYVTGYIAGLWEPKVSELKDIKTTKGLVAHHFVDRLVKDAKKIVADKGKSTRKVMRELFSQQYMERVEASIKETGALLLLQENQIEKSMFVIQLQKSTDSLLCILEELQLEPVDCEIELADEDFFDYGQFSGFIDCLLQNTKGEYVIFDFKWSERRDSYQELIKKGTAMQLELYRWAVEKQYGKVVAGVGYYLFPLCQLFTSDFAGSEYVKHIDTDEVPTTPFIDRMKNSINFRREQLKKGHIEESENLAFTEIDYVKHTENQQLLPLEVAYNDRKVKKLEKMHKASPYVNNQLRKNHDEPETNEIPTTHSILKARIK